MHNNSGLEDIALWDDGIGEAETIAGERRGDNRYDLRLDLRWKLMRRRKVVDQGTGRTMDLSSGGVLFETDRPLPVGLQVELHIVWPVLLHNVAPLQLFAFGRIVRSEENRAAVKLAQHEFRTAGIPADHRQVLAHSARNASVFLLSGAGMGKVQ